MNTPGPSKGVPTAPSTPGSLARRRIARGNNQLRVGTPPSAQRAASVSAASRVNGSSSHPIDASPELASVASAAGAVF
jgi:hypothetical protein